MRYLAGLFLAMLLLCVINSANAQRKVSIVGSSTSACFGVSVVDSCYVSRLKAYFNKQLPNDTIISNEFAVGGYTVYQGMPSWYVSPYPTPALQPDPGHNITAALATHPDVVLINYPTNGYDYLTVSEILFCLRTIRDAASQAGVPCFVTTTQPRTSGTFNTPAIKAKLALLKDSILAQFGSFAIDFYTGLINPADSSIRYDAGDGTHMNNTGHDSLFQRVLRKNIFGNPPPIPIPIPIPPACVVNTAPANAATIGTQTTATLAWNASANATSYDVYLWTGAVPAATPVANTTTTSFNAINLVAATAYSWYVVPKNQTGDASCGAINTTSFITAAVPIPVPGCATNTAPANGTTIATQTTATLAWNAFANATSYDVYIWSGAVPAATPVANTTITSFNAINLVAATAYSWYVVPKNQTGDASCGAINTTSFITAAVPIPVPGCTTNTAPANGTTVTTQTTATLAWNASANATSYDVYIWSGAVPAATPVANTTTTSFNAVNLVAATAYSWYVVPKNQTGDASCGAINTTSFITAAVPIPVPGCATNTAPANGTTIATQTTATLAWNASANATSYDVYIWSGAVPAATPVANTTTTSFNAINLVAATAYSWYVVPKNQTGDASCGAINTTSFITAAVPIPVPGCATNTAPANGTTIATQTTATLAWNAVANATSYDVYIWSGAVPAATPVANTTTTSFNAINLVAATAYSWYVVPKNQTGDASCGAINTTSFITAAVPIPVPGCTTNTAPANGTTIATQTTATLAWNASANATSYDVYIWSGAVPAATPVANTTTTSFNAVNLVAATAYSWYVVPKNQTGDASCGAINTTSFITAAVPIPVLSCATNTAPANGTTIATQTTATLAWNAVANATSYDVYIWSGAVPAATPVANTTTTSFNAINLVAATAYSWYVVPKNQTGAASCGAINTTSFITAAVPIPVLSCATNTAPANGTTIATQTTATLAWNAIANATSYDVYIWSGAVPAATPVANTTTTSFNAINLVAATAYSWYVVPKNQTGAASCGAINTTSFLLRLLFPYRC